MTDARTFTERVEDALLVQVDQLHRVRGIPVRGALADVRASCVDDLADSVGTDAEDIWRVRVDRCDALNQEPDDYQLRRRVVLALERER